MINLKEHQPALDIDGQIANLLSIGLIIEDLDYAKGILNDISYFRLIKGFGFGLKPKNASFKSVSFSQIVQLYFFNCNLRQIIFPAIEVIEINLRCRMANHISSKYGCFGYKDPSNFATIEYHTEFIDEIDSEIRRNYQSPFVANFQNNYNGGELPFYALIELFSFGLLSKFFKNLRNEDKKEIAKSFGTGYTYFESWIESISHVRNICAHYGRLYNAKLSKSPKLYSQYTGISNYRIFAIILCIKHILKDCKAWNKILCDLTCLMSRYKDVCLERIGFPENWRDVLMQ